MSAHNMPGPGPVELGHTADDVRTHEWYLELVEALGEALVAMLENPLGGYEQRNAYILSRSKGHYARGRYEAAVAHLRAALTDGTVSQP